jgi:hypothetical protein
MNDLTLSGDLHLVSKKNVPEPDLDQLNYIASPFPILPYHARILYDNVMAYLPEWYLLK